MKRRWLVNLILALAAAALAALAILRPGQEAGETHPPLTTIDKGAVKEIRIERPDQPAIRIVRSGNRWQLTAPFPARADRYRVEALLSVASAESLRQLAAKPEALADYGLDRPAATLWLDDHKIAFGARHPIAYQRYVLVDGQVHLIGASHFSQLEGRPEDLVDTRLLGDARPLAFAFPDFRLVLEQDGWHRLPADPALTADAITAFVDEWRHARALRVSRNTKRAQGEKIRVTVEDDGADQKTEVVFVVRGRAPELILQRPDEGLDYHFAKERAGKLLAIPRPAEPAAQKAPAAPPAQAGRRGAPEAADQRP